MKTLVRAILAKGSKELNINSLQGEHEHLKTIMDDYDIRSAASILASVKEQEARFERLTRALEEERRNVSLQLERANQP
ncbi:unnamed protein product, partial [Bubo scandiacus]